MQKEAELKVVVKKIVDCFKTRLPKRPHYDPFEILIATIISQNTNDMNTFRAMKALRKYGSTPMRLASTRVEDIARMIKVAGLQRQKARRIKNASRFILRKYDGDVKKIIKLSDGLIRKELMAIKGIGPKTVDVFLAFAKGSSVIPIDTHIFRISMRLGITKPKDAYEEVQRKLQTLITPRDRVSGHLALIQFGREICKARNP
ncbi:MAG: endonuclease III, partial [Candidatus Bathyarchaeia archaeon]